MTAESTAKRAALSIDPHNACVLRAAERVDLPPKAFAVLVYLAEHPGRIVTKDELLAAVWQGTFVGDDVLKVNIKQIRSALGDDAKNPWLIETVHRRGYRMVGPLRILQPITPPQVAAAHAEAPQAIGFVGRDESLAELDAHWSRADAGDRQIVFVTGEPGIGKSALVARFASRIELRPDRALVGYGYCLEDYGAGEAYLPVLEALEDLLRSAEDSTVAQSLRRYAPTWVARFPGLLDDGTPGEVVASGGGASREGMLRELSTALEILSQERPIALFLEDLHWCDPSTVALLAHVAQRRRPARLLIVATYRPVELIVAEHPLKAVKQTLQQRGQCVELPLRYLQRAEVAAFLGSRLDTDAEPSLVDFVHARTSGNPLFLHNVVEHLRSSALIESDNGRCRLAADVRDDIVPDAIDAAIGRRLDRLEATERAVLEAGSVAGMEFSAATVAAVVGADVLAVEAACERLARRGEILRAGGAATQAGGAVSGRYEFQHALIQNVLYRHVPPSRRTMMHRGVAACLEQNGAGAGELAFHFSRSGGDPDMRKAAAYAMRAAEAAKRVYAYDEAIRHGETACRFAALLTERDERFEAELTVQLAEVRQRAGRVTEGDRDFRAAAEAALRLGMPTVLARAAVGVGHSYQRIGVVDHELIHHLEEAISRLEPGDQALKALALAHLDYALCSVANSQSRRAGLGSEALAMARRVGDVETHAWVLQYNRWAFGGPRSEPEWRAGIREIESILPRVADAERELMLRYVLITDLLDVGDVDRAHAEVDEMQRRAVEAQIPWCLWIGARLRTAIALLEGKLAASEDLIRECYEHGVRTDHPNLLQMVGAQSCLLKIERGALTEALAIVDVAIAQNPTVATWRAVAAALAAELGDTARATRECEPFEERGIEQLPQDTSWLVATGFLSVAAFRSENAGLGVALYETLLPHRNRCTGMGSSILSLGHTERYVGLAAAAAGRPEAEEHLRRAVVENDRIGARPWAVFARRDLARFLRRRKRCSKEADRLLAHATVDATDIGMVGWLPLLADSDR